MAYKRRNKDPNQIRMSFEDEVPNVELELESLLAQMEVDCYTITSGFENDCLILKKLEELRIEHEKYRDNDKHRSEYGLEYRKGKFRTDVKDEASSDFNKEVSILEGIQKKKERIEKRKLILENLHDGIFWPGDIKSVDHALDKLNALEEQLQTLINDCDLVIKNRDLIRPIGSNEKELEDSMVYLQIILKRKKYFNLLKTKYKGKGR